VTPHIFLSKNPRGENLVQVADITSGIMRPTTKE
jgi:hypothetical protein